MPLPKTPVTKEKALERLMSLCARSEQCVFELERKLYNWGISKPQRKEIITYLQENRYLDDARFAKCFAKDKAKFSSWGPLKIKSELIRRKIQPLFIREAIAAVEPDIWKETILKCARAKARTLRLPEENSIENKQKLFRYLISRGFPSSLASKAVNFILRPQND